MLLGLRNINRIFPESIAIEGKLSVSRHVIPHKRRTLRILHSPFLFLSTAINTSSKICVRSKIFSPKYL